jgi:hypothetical protein
MTPTGPTVVSGENEPKLKASAEDIQSAALDFLKQNTEAPKEEAKPEEPAAPAQSTEEFLGSLKERGVNDRRINKKLKFLTGDTRPHFDAMADTVADFQAAHDDLKSKMSGLVVTDKDLTQVDLAGDLHKHIGNLLNQAQRHLSAAALKEQDGRRGSAVQGAPNLLKRKTATRIRQEDLAGGRDTLERYAPIDAGATGDRPPAENESIKFLNEYTSNDFLKQSENFEAMGSADHVEHARRLLAGVAQSIPQALEQIHRTPELKAQMANAGKMAPLPGEATRTFNKLMVKFMGPAQSYLDYAAANPGKDADKKGPTIYDAFGLDHHLKALSNLAKSSNIQKIIESQHALIEKVYNQRYGSILAKRAAGRGHAVANTPEPVTTSPDNLDNISENTRAELEDSRRYLRNVSIGDTKLPQVSDEEFNSIKAKADSAEQKAVQENLTNRAAALTSAGSTHRLGSKWTGIISKATALGSQGGLEKAHKLLDSVQTSMEKNGISLAGREETRVQSPQGSSIPTLEEFKKLANVGSPTIENKDGLVDPNVDITWGGTTDIETGRTGVQAGPSWMRGRRTTQIMNPSSRGFNVPSEQAWGEARKRSRKAAMESAAAAAQASVDNRYRYDPFFGGSVAPIGGKQGLMNEVSAASIRSDEVDESGILKPGVERSDPFILQKLERDRGISSEELQKARALREKAGWETTVVLPKQGKAKTSRASKAKELETAINDVADSMAPGTTSGTTAAERAASMFSDRRK